MTCCCTHRSVLCSSHIREALPCSRWEFPQTYNWTVSKEWHSVLNMMSSSNLSPQASRIEVEKRRQTDSKSWQMTPRKQHVPDTGGLMHVWAHEDWQHTNGLHRFKMDKMPVLKGRSGLWVPTLIKKLSATDTHWQREQSGFFQHILIGYINHA